MAPKRARKATENVQKEDTKPKRGRPSSKKTAPPVEEPLAVVQEPSKHAKKSKSVSSETKPTPKKVVSSKGPPVKRKPTLGVRRGAGGAGRSNDKPAPDDSNLETPSQEHIKMVKGKIQDILVNSKVEEQAIIDAQNEISDSEDESPVLQQDAQDVSQAIMMGHGDYTSAPHIGEDDANGSDDDLMDLTCGSTKMHMIQHDTSIFDDPTKSHDDWWTEDETREITLCELWNEEESLYNVRGNDYLNAEDKQTILKRFSTVLHVPPKVISVRMASLRNHYQRMHRVAASGSEPEGTTDRQREILRLLFFLRKHIKTSASLTTYRGVSPVPSPIPMAKKIKAAASTPRFKKEELQEGDEEAMDLSAAGDKDLTPIKTPTPTPSELEYDLEQDSIINAKHFSRNERLHDDLAVESSIRRSLRLSPIPKVPLSNKKTTDPKKIKKSKSQALPTLHRTVDVRTSTCTDTAPLADATKLKAKVTEKKKVVKAAAAVVQADVVEKPLNAAERKAALVQAAQAVQADKEKPTTSTETVEKVGNTSTAAERRAAMVKKPLKDDSSQNYSVDLQWYEKSGPAYRRAMETDKKKKDKSKDVDMVNLMKEKTDAIKKISDNLDQQKSSTAEKIAHASTPEQLWADSLIPHMKQMEEDVKDEFMLHVLGLAMRAKKGRWP